MNNYKLMKWNSGVNVFIFLLLGLLLLIFPIESLSIGSYLIASILMLGGIGHLIRIYKNKGIETNQDIMYLLFSIVSIGVSISIFIDPTWIIRAINIVVGIILIVSAFMNLSGLLNYTKNRTTSWWLFFSLLIIVFILGILIIVNPLWLASIITRLEGATLVINALITIVLTKKTEKLLQIKEDNSK